MGIHLTGPFDAYRTPSEYLHSPNIRDQKVTQLTLNDFLIQFGQTRTPTIENRLMGGVKALALAIGLAILHPFAALASLPIETDLDPQRHPHLVKIGRNLEAPRLFSLFAYHRFLGYYRGGSLGKAQIIVAQCNEAIIWKKIASTSFANYADQVRPPETSEFYQFFQENLRLLDLRTQNGDRLARPNLTFGDLIREGYLQAPIQ